jgi:N-acetylmuramoyl-L-alanine amidase
LEKGKRMKQALTGLLVGTIALSSMLSPVSAKEPETTNIEQIHTAAAKSTGQNLQPIMAGTHVTNTLTIPQALGSDVSFEKYEIEYNKYPNNNVEYIVIHDTGNPRAGADAISHYEYFAGGDRGASAHYFVDDHEVVQIIDDTEGSWHAGVRYKNYATPISNTNSIGIEMCINSDGNYTEALNHTADLAAYLLWTYSLPVDNLVRHYDANGKLCPQTMAADNWALWKEFKSTVSQKLAAYQNQSDEKEQTQVYSEWYSTPILGESTMSAETMAGFLISRNDGISWDHAMRVANAYISLGSVYGIRGDIAFFQAVLETGYLRYGGDADDSYMNFCGLFNHDGSDYAKFDSVEQGVEAHIQHLFAYAATGDLPQGRTLLDPRFDLIERGCRTSWEGLSGRWAVPGYDEASYDSLEEALDAHASYGDIIVGLYLQAGGEDLRSVIEVAKAAETTSEQTSQEKTSESDSYWDNPVYTGSAAGTRTQLSLGMGSDDVSELQMYLNTLGYTVDQSGYFGEETLKAVKHFQKDAGLVTDGIVGEDTWGAVINRYVSKKLGKEVAGPSPEEQNTQNTQHTQTALPVSGRSTLSIGSSGSDVLALQKLLNALGYGLEEDGIFGNGTYSAVIAFQKSKALETDGIVGNQTWTALGSSETGSTPQPVTETTGSADSRPSLSYGSTGEHVKTLQQLLNSHGASLETDGIFGQATDTAVRNFQSSSGLVSDGIVGPLTWAKLN